MAGAFGPRLRLVGRRESRCRCEATPTRARLEQPVRCHWRAGLGSLEEVHRKQSAEETPDAEIIANLETEIEAKRTEFEGLGGTY